MPRTSASPGRPFRIVANPPFGISTALLRRALAAGSHLVTADIVLPLHVARRWTSPGHRARSVGPARSTLRSWRGCPARLPTGGARWTSSCFGSGDADRCDRQQIRASLPRAVAPTRVDPRGPLLRRRCRDALSEAGLRGFWMGYFAARSAPMGPVAAPVVTATFFNFNPMMVERALPGCMDVRVA